MCNILLIEDSKIQHIAVAKKLTELTAPYELVIVQTLAAAKKALSDTCLFDVIILDLGLPDTDGVVTFTELISVCKDIPIIVYTADDTLEIALECIRQGAETVLIKPYLGPLARQVAYATERRRIRKMLEDLVRKKIELVACDFSRHLQQVKETLKETSDKLGMATEEKTRWVETKATPGNC